MIDHFLLVLGQEVFVLVIRTFSHNVDDLLAEEHFFEDVPQWLVTYHRI